MACPQCSSQRIWKDGLRRTRLGPVQRYLCRQCGYQFSEPKVHLRPSGISEGSQSVQKVHTKFLRPPADKPILCQIGAAQTTGAKNLAETQEIPTQEKAQRGATPAPDQATVKGKLLECARWLKNQGYSDATIETCNKILKAFIKNGADIFNPESIKEAIAKNDHWSQNTKHLAVDVYTWFLEMQGLTWKRPIYEETRAIPFIPMEQEIDQLIAASGKTLAACLQLLKETGMRIGEALRLTWLDVDSERNVIRASAEKNSNPRILSVSSKLIAMLNMLPKKSERIFPQTRAGIKHMLWVKRQKLALNLQNPRLTKISFHTFRHWKGTMEYHKTKDPYHVKQILGHKSLQTTELYINIEQALFQTENDEFHVNIAHNLNEACKLLEVGFEYVTDMDNVKIFRKRK